MAGGGGNGVGRSGSEGGGRTGGGSGSGGLAVKGKEVGAPGVDTRVRVQYDAHLPALYLHNRENLRNILAYRPPHPA